MSLWGNTICTFFEVIAVMLLILNINDKKIGLLKLLSLCLVAAFLIAGVEYVNFPFNELVLYIIMFVVIKLTTKNSIGDVLLEMCIIILVLIVFQLISMTIMSLVFGTYDSGDLIHNLLLSSASFVFSYIMYKCISLYKLYKRINYNIKVILFLVANNICIIIIIKLFWNYNSKLVLKNSPIIMAVMLVMLFLNIILYRYIIKVNENESKIEIYEKTIETTSNIIDDIRSKQHEYKNHISVIDSMLATLEKSEDVEALNKYLINFKDKIDSANKLVKSNSAVINSIIISKSYEANINGIDFSFSIDDRMKELPISNFEMTEIIGILLDNAFEECMSSGLEKKVSLEMYKFEGRFNIKVKNIVRRIGSEELIKLFHKGYSTKGEKGRGFGLHNLKTIVKDNEGEIKIYNENEYIVFEILF